MCSSFCWKVTETVKSLGLGWFFLGYGVERTGRLLLVYGLIPKQNVTWSV